MKKKLVYGLMFGVSLVWCANTFATREFPVLPPSPDNPNALGITIMPALGKKVKIVVTTADPREAVENTLILSPNNKNEVWIRAKDKTALEETGALKGRLSLADSSGHIVFHGNKLADGRFDFANSEEAFYISIKQKGYEVYHSKKGEVDDVLGAAPHYWMGDKLYFGKR